MKIFYYLLILVLLFSCKKDEDSEKKPVSKFEINTFDPVAPAEVTFTNLSTDAEDYIWDFGDGSTSLDFEPNHYYSAPGEYVVELIVYGLGGKDISSANVVLKNIGDARFTIENKSDFTIFNVKSFYLDWDESIIYDIVEHGDIGAHAKTVETTTTIPTIEVLFEFEGLYFHLAYPTDAIEGEVVNIPIYDTTSCYVFETDPILVDKSSGSDRKFMQINELRKMKITDY